MGNKTLRNYVIICLALSSTVALANPITDQNAPLENTHKPYSASLSAGINSNLLKTDTPDHTLDSDFNASVSLKPDAESAVTLSLGGVKNLKGERKFYWNDGSLSYSRRLYKDELYSLSGLMLAVIPMSDDSRDNQGLRTGLLVAPTLTSGFTTESFVASFRPSVRYNFHRYRTSRLGGSNTEYALSARLTLSYSFTDSISVSAVNTYTRNTTYYGNTKDAYAFIQSIDYQATPELSLSLGHANGGSVLAPNGTETDIDLYDDISSTVFFALTLSL